LQTFVGTVENRSKHANCHRVVRCHPTWKLSFDVEVRALTIDARRLCGDRSNEAMTFPAAFAFGDPGTRGSIFRWRCRVQIDSGPVAAYLPGPEDRSGKMIMAATRPSDPPRSVSQARAASRGTECTPLAASVTINVKANAAQAMS
jgi:hypothetical protein